MTVRWLRYGSTILALGLLGGLPSALTAGTTGAAVDQGVAPAFVEKGTTARGEMLYLALTQWYPSHTVSDRIHYSFEYGNGKSSALDGVGSMKLALEALGQLKNYIFPSDPNPPTHPGWIGQREPNNYCGMISIGNGSITGDISVEYEYRYTRDADRDGTNDSDPEWVIVNIGFQEWPPNVTRFCE